MFGALSRWIDRRRQERAAIAAAVRHFESATGESAHSSGNAVLGEEARGKVVRVCHGSSRPPRRVWYLVSGESAVVRELSEEEASRWDERPWR